MTNEQLTELARQYAQDRYCSETNETPKYKIAQIHAGRDGFIKGAKYMRNSPWHTDKEPFYERKGKKILVLAYKYGQLEYVEVKDFEELIYTYIHSKDGFSFKYAYIEELLPMEK